MFCFITFINLNTSTFTHLYSFNKTVLSVLIDIQISGTRTKVFRILSCKTPHHYAPVFFSSLLNSSISL